MRAIAFLFVVAACTPVSAPETRAIPPSASVATTASVAPSASPAVSASASASSASAPSGAVVAPNAERDKRIHDKFGARCRLERTCGALWGIDCDAAVDGPYYYVKAETLEKVSDCGGYCMGGRCTNCPPKEWTCATY